MPRFLCPVRTRHLHRSRSGGINYLTSHNRSYVKYQGETNQFGRDQRIDAEILIVIVAKTLGIDADEVCAAGKQPRHVQARSLLLRAVRELGMTAATLAKTLGLSQPAITLAVSRENIWLQIKVGICQI